MIKSFLKEKTEDISENVLTAKTTQGENFDPTRSTSQEKKKISKNEMKKGWVLVASIVGIT